MGENINQPDNGINLRAQWDTEHCPIVDGIIFRDGRVRRMAVQWVRGESGRLALSVRPAGWTSLAELAGLGQLQWTGVIPLCTITDVGRNLRVIGGEGGFGSNGFVATVRADDGEIRWIAFFNESNPFEVVELVGNQLLAKTNLGTCWRFPLDLPEAVTLQ